MKWKAFLIPGLCCIGIGAALTITGATTGAFDSERRMEVLGLTSQTDTIPQPFSSVLLEIDCADVTIRPGDTAKIETTGIFADDYQIEVADEMLCITYTAAQNSWPQIGFWNFQNAQFTVTLPETEYRMLALKLDFGDCSVQGIHANTLSLDLDAGDCEIRQVEAGALTIQNDFGDCTIEDAAISGGCAAELDSGNCVLTDSTIGGLCQVENAFGDVTLADVTFGAGEMTLDAGDLRLKSVTQRDETSATSLTAEFGEILLSNSALWNSQIALDSGDLTATSTALYGATTITSDMGDIDLILAGTQADYQVYQTISAGQTGGGNVIQIQQEMGETEVSFTD